MPFWMLTILLQHGRRICFFATIGPESNKVLKNLCDLALPFSLWSTKGKKIMCHSCNTVDVAVPQDSRVDEQQRETNREVSGPSVKNSEGYGEIPVEVASIIIGALGTIPQNVKKKRNLEKLEVKVAPPPGLMQKRSVVLETALISQCEVMDS